MQLDVANEPYLSKQQFLFILLRWFIISAMHFVHMILDLHVGEKNLWISIQSDFWSSPDGQTDRQNDRQTDIHTPGVLLAT